MTKSKSAIKLGNKLFKTCSECKSFLWNILKQQKGQVIDQELINILNDLIKRHINYKQKIGIGIEYFYISKSSYSSNKCFHIMRTDGTYTDFGIDKCLQNLRKNNLNSLRKIISYQIDAFKSRYNGNKTFISQYSGKEIKINDMHCDHIIPFEIIAEKFCENELLDIENQLLTVCDDNNIETQLLTIELTKKWKEFHIKFPLRVVSSNENLSIIRKEQLKLGKDYFNLEIQKYY